jgi:hypothetical protein
MVSIKRKNDDGAEQNADAKETQPRLYGFRGVYVFDRLSRDLRLSLCALDVCPECNFRKSLDSSKHIIAQLLCQLQRSLTGLRAQKPI